MVSTQALPYPHYQGELSSTATQCHQRQEAVSAPLVSCPSGWLTCTHPSRASSAVVSTQGLGPTLPNSADHEGLGHFFCSHTLEASSPMPLPHFHPRGPAHTPPAPRPALLCCQGEGQGQIICSYDPRASSLENSWWWGLKWGRGPHTPMPPHSKQVAKSALLSSSLQGWVTCAPPPHPTPTTRVSSAVLLGEVQGPSPKRCSRWGSVLAFRSSWPCRQLSRLPEVATSEPVPSHCSFPTFTSSDLAHPHPSCQGQLYCVTWARLSWELPPIGASSPECQILWGTGPAGYSPWTSTWSLAAALTRDIAMFSSHRHDIDHCHCVATDSVMALSGNSGWDLAWPLGWALVTGFSSSPSSLQCHLSS